MPDFPRPMAVVDYDAVARRVWTWTRDRAVKLDELDRLPYMEAHLDPIEGTATFSVTDTYPKTITLIDTSTLPVVGKQHIVEGYLDLSALSEGESLTVRQYMKIKPDGKYIPYAEETYTGLQALPMLYIVTKPARYGLKLEIVMQTAPSSDRNFDYQFFIKSVK